MASLSCYLLSFSLACDRCLLHVTLGYLLVYWIGATDTLSREATSNYVFSADIIGELPPEGSCSAIMNTRQLSSLAAGRPNCSISPAPRWLTTRPPLPRSSHFPNEATFLFRESSLTLPHWHSQCSELVQFSYWSRRSEKLKEISRTIQATLQPSIIAN